MAGMIASFIIGLISGAVTIIILSVIALSGKLDDEECRKEIERSDRK